MKYINTTIRLLVVLFEVRTIVNILKVLNACGIFPFDRNLFDDDDFVPLSVTDHPCPDYAPREKEPIIQPTPLDPESIEFNMSDPCTKDYELRLTLM